MDRHRFQASSYRAAHWQGIGWTRGFARRPEGFVQHGHQKEVYVYVMEPRMRRWIHGDDRQPLLSRSFLLAQRESPKTNPHQEKANETNYKVMEAKAAA